MRKFILMFVFAGFLLSVFESGSESTPAPRIGQRDQQRSSSTTEQTADAKRHLFVTGSRVNQRVAPSTSHRVLGQLVEGDKVRLISVEGEWKEIVSSLGRGWMHSAYLSTSAPVAKRTSVQEKKRSVAAPSAREVANARREIIRQSIRSYAGSCPCPYNRDRAGRRCGGRSAWSKPGGYSPICYDSDISASRLATYFARIRGASN